MSQRSLFALLAFIIFGAIGAVAIATGHSISIAGDLNTQIVSLFVPFTLVFTTINGFFNTLDTLVSDGTLIPSDLKAMFALKEFWVAVVAVGVAAAQVFGVEVLNAQTQEVVVAFGLLMTTVLFRSLSNRAPGAALSKVQKLSASQTAIQNRGDSHSYLGQPPAK